MKVLVTGASGFIGSHVVRELVTNGHEVFAIVREGDLLMRLLDIKDEITVLYGEIDNVLVLLNEAKVAMPEVCVHLAWYTEPGQYLNSNRNLSSLQTSVNLLNKLFENGCEHFVGAGTCAEYESTDEILLETAKLRPDTLYAATKVSFSLIGEQIAKKYNKKFSWGRIFYLYGPYEDSRRLIPSAIISLINGREFLASSGAQLRDFLHVRDVARAFVTILQQKATGFFNICSATPISVKEILEMIEKIFGLNNMIRLDALPNRAWEPMYICGSNGRLRSIGWSPLYNNRSGLEDVVDWWKNNYLMENK